MHKPVGIALLIVLAACSVASAGPKDCWLALFPAPVESAVVERIDGCSVGVRACVFGGERCRLRRRSISFRIRRTQLAEGAQCAHVVLSTSGDSPFSMPKVSASGRIRGAGRVRAKQRMFCARVNDEPPSDPPTPDEPPSDPPTPDEPPSNGTTCEGVTLPVPAIGRRAHLPPSLPLLGTCADGEAASNYTTPGHLVPPGQADELHVVSVYEPFCSAPAPEWPHPCLVAHDPVRVVVEPREKPVTLVLAAYDAVRWQIEVRPGATVRRVLTGGYHAQEVVGVPREMVESVYLPYAYGWEVSRNTGGGEFWSLLEQARGLTGLVETSFQGCYTGREFAIPYDADPPTTCEASPVDGDETLTPEQVAFPGCADVLAESTACLTVTQGGLALLGVDSGASCPVAPVASHSLYDLSSLGWLGDVLYACSYNEGLVRLDVQTGAVERLEMPCAAATADAGSLLILTGYEPGMSSNSSVFRVAGYDGLLAGEAEATGVTNLWGERMTARDGLLYSAWHSTNTIQVHDLATGELVREVVLEGYDNWINGLDVTPDGRLLILGYAEEGLDSQLMVFDAVTGARLGTHLVPSADTAMGLECRSGR